MSQDEYFKLINSLAEELNSKQIKLTSFPDVVTRIRKALDDPETTGEKLATILSVDPVLASRVLVLANSTYHNPGGIMIESLDAAVSRVGFEQVRTAAITYAVEQLHSSEGLEELNSEMRQTWSAGMRLAAMSDVMARHCTKLDADSAFIAGLLNRIGVLYLFSKYEDYPNLLRDVDARQNLIDEWAPPIGESIVANWKFSEDIQSTLNPDETDQTRRHTEASLVDIVVAARAALNGGEEQLYDTAEAKRMHLTDDKMVPIMKSYRQKLDSLASAVR